MLTINFHYHTDEPSEAFEFLYYLKSKHLLDSTTWSITSTPVDEADRTEAILAAALAARDECDPHGIERVTLDEM